MLKRTFITITTLFVLMTFFFAVQPEIINAQSRKDKRKAEKLVQDANKLYRQNDFKTAIDKYAEAISLYPGYAEAHFWKGNAHNNLNQGDQAIDDLDIALQQGYKPLEVYRVRWFLHYQKQNYDAALKDAEAGLQIEPESPFFLLALGDIYRGRESYEKAIDYYEKAAPKEQRNADLPFYLAISYKGLGRNEKQAAAAQEAIEKGTKFPGEAWELLGDANLKQGKTDDAIEAFERAITANKDLHNAYGILSEIYRSQGNFKKAISTMEKGLKVFENDSDFLINLTWYHSLAGNNNDAIREGQKAVKYAPENASAFTSLCRAYNDTGQHKLALDTCKKALEMNSSDGETHYYMGRAYDKLGQTDAATAEFKKAVEGLENSTKKNPENADFFYLLGGAYYADAQRDKAVGAYKRALEISPRFARAHYNLAYLYYLKGDATAARRQYELLKPINSELADQLDKAMKK